MFFGAGSRLLRCALLTTALIAGCSSGGSGEATGSADVSGVGTFPSEVDTVVTESGTDVSSSTAGTSDEDEPILAPGQTAGQDDYNDDGRPDPTCGEQDFGGGLVIRILCDLEGRNSAPPDGVTLVENSLFRLPTDSDVDLTGISGSAVYGRDKDGGRVYVIVFSSDALFETGSADIAGSDTFDNLARLINRDFPGSTLQVRGHTDSTGSDEANLKLSEARAAAAASYLKGHNVDVQDITSIGFGEAQPLSLEDNEEGLKFNRRVEIVIRPVA